MFIKKIILSALCILFLVNSVFAIDPLFLKKLDLQPYYYAQVTDSTGLVIDLSGATVYVTMKNLSLGTVKINRQTTGLYITDAANGKFEYRWQTGNTDTVGKYSIEFEINPLTGGKFTVPTGDRASVQIFESLDTQ
jgi:hypothetical protein